jgi:uncharacterized protein (DUF1810 family)
MERRMSSTAGNAVLGWIDSLRIGEPITHEQMVLFPVFVGVGASDILTHLAYVTLGEAIADGSVEVVEREHASVPELVLRNRGESMVLVLDGEEIVGGKQNRIVNASFLVAAKSEVALPVTCVEHGRWHDVAPNFKTGEASFASLRMAKMGQVRDNIRERGQPMADQSAVWDTVAEQQSLFQTQSPTGAMNDIYRDSEDKLRGYEEAYPYVESTIGMVVALHGRMVGADMFDQPRTMKTLWPRLVRSYALDALSRDGSSSPVGPERAKRSMERAKTAKTETYQSLALGEDVRLEGEGVIGAALVYEGIPIHTSLFRVRGGQRRAGHAEETPNIARHSLRLRRRFGA